jgi:hypothetical protein
MFIQQAPLDVLQYLSNRNRYNILNDVITQMNLYLECVEKFRKHLFSGKVSIVGHSLGSVIMYDILTNMTKNEVKQGNKFNFQFEVDPHNLDMSNTKHEQILLLNRKKRKNNLKAAMGRKGEKSNFNFNPTVSEAILMEIDVDKIQFDFKKENSNNNENNPTVTISSNSDIEPCDKISIEKEENKFNSEKCESSRDQNNITYEQKKVKVYSKNENLTALNFTIEHFFLLGSPLSLFLTVEHGVNSFLEEMEIVQDFHNIIHPMDPVAYRIEPLILNYPETKSSFTLPHYQNDGIKNLFFYNLTKIFCCENKNEEIYLNHDRKIGRKRYDFMVQESIGEKAVTTIGFLFSHMAYWHNPDVFYFILKMVHWQGYNHAHHNSFKYNYNSAK